MRTSMCFAAALIGAMGLAMQVAAVENHIEPSPNSQKYYSVSDQDGYSNLRNGPNSEEKVLKRVNSGHCVVGLFEDGGWTKVIVVFANEYLQVSGFIHSSKLKKDNRCKDDPSIRSIPKGEFALEGLDSSKGFQEAAIWFKNYGKNLIDDGSYAEGYSEYVMHTLAESFNTSVTFLSGSKKSNPAFAQFILRHIDATGNASDLEVILNQARKCSVPSSAKTCAQIEQRAKSAIDEMSQPNGPSSN